MGQQATIGKIATTVSSNEDFRLIVRYHQTDVVRVSYDNLITLDSDGWQTYTTKTRMNQASNQYNLGFCVFQKDFEWFVKLADGKVLTFTDGMRFYQIGDDPFKEPRQ